MPINKNAIKLAQMLDLNVEKSSKLLNSMSLSDLAALTTAINSDDFLTVREIYNRYKHEIDDVATPAEVKQYYDVQLMQNPDQDEALASTADFYGIKGEDVERLLGRYSESQKKDRNTVFIPDAGVARAYKNLQEILKGGKSDGSIVENCKRAWQRRMFYGMIPPSVSLVIQDVIDMTPIAVMQQYAKMHGYGEPALEESTMSLEAMMDKIIEDHLHNLDKESEDMENTIISMDMGTIEPEKEPEDKKKGKLYSLIQKITKKRF